MKSGFIASFGIILPMLFASFIQAGDGAITILGGEGGIQFPDGSTQTKSATLPGCVNGGVLVYNSGSWYCGAVMPVNNGVATCINSICEMSACMQDYGNCDSNPANGCETALTTTANCGSCGVACPESTACSTYTCTNTACTPEYHPGTSCPGGTCDDNGSCVQFPTVMNETNLPLEADYCNIQWPPSITSTAGAQYLVYGQIYEVGMTEAPGPNANITAQLGYGPSGTNPITEPSAWTFFNAAYNVQAGNNDEYFASFNTPVAGAYNYVFRFSLDNGASYTYCDTDGAGSGASFDFSPSAMGVMTMTP